MHLVKTGGALPATAMEYSERLDMYRNEFPEDQAEVMMTALMMLGKTAIPALAIPTTNGEEPAPTPPLVRAEALEGQMMPMTRTPPM